MTNYNKALTEEKLNKILEVAKENPTLSTRDIAERFALNISTVRKQLQKAGLGRKRETFHSRV